MERNDLNNTKICVVGLGYVGLPLFCLLSSNYRCVGLDQDVHRVALLNQGYDVLTIEEDELFNKLELVQLTTRQMKDKDLRYYGFRLLAVDGSDLQIAANPNDPDSYDPGVNEGEERGQAAFWASQR